MYSMATPLLTAKPNFWHNIDFRENFINGNRKYTIIYYFYHQHIPGEG